MERKNEEERKIVPDMPQMRSVMIGAPRTMPLPPRSLLRSGPPTTKSAPGAIRKPVGAKWAPKDIPALPDFYPLERTHAIVEDTPVDEVATRVASALRECSLAPTFEGHKASAETQCHVRLVVQLFTQGEKIVVEVQRRCGCSFVYRQIAKSVIKAVKGGKVKVPAPRALPKVPKSIFKEEDRKQECEEALEIAADLITKESFDSQLLGIQSLAQLTAGDATKVQAAKTILRGPIYESVLSFIRPLGDEEETKDDSMTEHRGNMKMDAFSVLANCFSAVSGKISFDGIANDELLEMIIEQLRTADETPHSACHAARALKALLTSSEAVKLRADQLDAAAAVLLAHKEGVNRHLMLEEVTKYLKEEVYPGIEM